MKFKTIQVEFKESICYLRFNRPEQNNTINDCLIKECLQLLEVYEETIKILILEGSSDIFCMGADFEWVHKNNENRDKKGIKHSMDLYDLWIKLATGPYITISHVRGKVNAGGVGFVAASDIVISDHTVQFSLSELLFGLFPAAVLPFLIRRVGFQKAHYLTLITKPILIEQAYEWGLVDAYDSNSTLLLRKHLLRLSRISKDTISRYKRYAYELDHIITKAKPLAMKISEEMFSDEDNLQKIKQYIQVGKLPWEDD